jgi:hypothetical protein
MKKFLHSIFLYLLLLPSLALAQPSSSPFGPVPPSDAPYDATTWDGSMLPPTQNAVRDEIESIIASPTFSGDILPDTDNAYDIGSLTHRFRNLYLSGIATAPMLYGTTLYGTTLYGSTASGGDASIQSTSHATKGTVTLGGDVVVKATTNDGSTDVLSLTDSDDVKVFSIDTTGNALINNAVVKDTMTVGTNGTDGTISLYSEQGGTDYTVTLNPNATMTEDTSYTLPPNKGSAGYVLSTDGTGAMSWSVVGHETVVSTISVLDVDDMYQGTLANYGQGAVDVYVELPVAAANMSAVCTIGTAQAGNVWGVKASVSDKIYLDGVAGSDGEYVVTTPVVGTMLRLRTVKTGASSYDWIAISDVGTWLVEDSFDLVAETGDTLITEGSDQLIVG